jgi:thiamine pyrophosphate-dependent acetolactate synthase large subunit-like protein
VAQTGPVARSMVGLDNLFLNRVKIGEGFGVPAVAVDSAEILAQELERALMHKGPHLIEAVLEGCVYRPFKATSQTAHNTRGELNPTWPIATAQPRSVRGTKRTCQLVR